MGSKLRPDKKTTEELLKDLENSSHSDKRKIHVNDDILSFLRFYNLEEGRFKVKSYVLYKLYRWYTQTPRSKMSFHLKMNQYLPIHKERDEVYYKINRKAVNLTEKALEILKPKREKTLYNGNSLNFKNFIKKFNLKIGTDDSFIWISIDMLYDLYDEWTYNIYKKNPMDRYAFMSFCSLYFPKCKRSSDVLWFQMSETIKETLTEERISRLKARKLNPDEKESKNRNKISRVKSIPKSKN